MELELPGRSNINSLLPPDSSPWLEQEGSAGPPSTGNAGCQQPLCSLEIPCGPWAPSRPAVLSTEGASPSYLPSIRAGTPAPLGTQPHRVPQMSRSVPPPPSCVVVTLHVVLSDAESPCGMWARRQPLCSLPSGDFAQQLPAPVLCAGSSSGFVTFPPCLSPMDLLPGSVCSPESPAWLQCWWAQWPTPQGAQDAASHGCRLISVMDGEVRCCGS